MTPFRELAYAGYGLIFISHETEKPYTDDNGKEYNKIIPALPNRPFQLISSYLYLMKSSGVRFNNSAMYS